MNATSNFFADEPVSIPSSRTMRGRTTPRGERLRAGDVLLGRYTVLSELGEGGMGVVYKCLDAVGGIEVALKCLPPELSRNETEMEGIRENYAIVARLHHSAISGLRQLEKDPDFGEYYLVMDLAEGDDLSAILRRRRGAPMPLSEALSILRPLAAALDYAHGEKVLHRDVKPANVKVRPATTPGGAPRVQLLDFGLAAEVRSSLSRVSRKGYLGSSGTPAYMAPEQWEARQQGPATDQYALAVVAYQMLAGTRPFDVDDPDLLRRAVLGREPDPIPILPRRANAALLRALSKDPTKRFPTCAAFVEALSNGRDASTMRPRLVAALGALVVVGMLGAVLLPTRGGKDKDHAEFAESAELDGRARSPSGPFGGASRPGEPLPSSSSPSPSSPAPPARSESAFSLPPEGAARAELEDALAQLEARRDGLSSQGYAAPDPERAPVEEAITALEARIEAALAEESRKAREAELAGRRDAAKRAGLVETERALDALAKECAAADAAKLAAAALRKADRARADAEKRRDEGLYEEAATGYAAAKTLYGTARTEARAAKAAVETESARTYEAAKMWDKCLAAAQKALEWEPDNKDAAALKRKAEAEIKKIADAKAAAERKKKEESRKAEEARKAAEEARKAAEEARKAAEEARLAAERKAKEEAEHRAREEEQNRTRFPNGQIQIYIR